MRPVINDLAGTTDTACFQEVDAQPFASVKDATCIYLQAPELTNERGGEVIGRKPGYKPGMKAVISQRYGHVGLASTVGGLKLLCLIKAQVTGSGKTKHNFAKCYNRIH